MGTESRFGARTETFAGILQRGGAGRTNAKDLARLFGARRAVGEYREQPQNSLALLRITEDETHTHAEPGMGTEHLSLDLEFHIRRADQDFDAGLAGERGWHLDVASTFAEIGKRSEERRV